MSELYQLPDGWEWKTLDEIKISNAIGLVRSQAEQSLEHPYKYVKMNNITNDNRFTLDNITNVRASDEEIKKYSLLKGDLLFNTRNSNELVGKSCIYDLNELVLYNNNIMRIRFKSNVNSYFVGYQFSSNLIQGQLNDIKSGTTNVSAIYYKELKDIAVIIPPLAEQKRIVQKLDALFERIDKAIALLQKNIDAADNFMNSVLNDVFSDLEQSDGVQPLSNVVTINSGIALPSIFKDKENTVGEFQFFKVAQMNNDKKIMKNADLKFTKNESINFKIKLFPIGSVLIPKRGGAILTNKKRMLISEASYDSNIMGLKADNNILSDEFLYLFLLSIDLSNYIDESTIPQINNKHIEMMRISIPSLTEQEKIVLYLNEVSAKIEQVKSAQQQKMQNLLGLKSSILDQAFHGKL